MRPVAVLAAFIALPALPSAQDVEKGKALYTANKCQQCHAIAGKGNKKYPLDGVGAKLSGDDISKLYEFTASRSSQPSAS